MALYNYSPYQYNQSDELAKQMFAQQALASSLPRNHEVPDSHGMPASHPMPTPTGAPWNIQGIPWGMRSPPQLMNFTGQPLMIEEKLQTPVLHTKRKSYDIEAPIPTKQLITEDKMAAHLNGLHISSDYTTHSLQTEEVMDVAMETPSVSERLKGHTIVLSDEIKKIRDTPLIPAALLERLEKPCMSLVLWKPKENLIEKQSEPKKKEEDETETHEPVQSKRNGLLVSEYGEMDIEM